MARAKLLLRRQEVPSQSSLHATFEQELRSKLSSRGIAAWEAFKASHASVWTSLGILSQVDLERDMQRLVDFFEPSSH